MTISIEIIEKIRNAKSKEELIEQAKCAGIEISKEQAEEMLNKPELFRINTVYYLIMNSQRKNWKW